MFRLLVVMFILHLNFFSNSFKALFTLPSPINRADIVAFLSELWFFPLPLNNLLWTVSPSISNFYIHAPFHWLVPLVKVSMLCFNFDVKGVLWRSKVVKTIVTLVMGKTLVDVVSITFGLIVCVDLSLLILLEMNFSHFGVDIQGALFSFIVRVRNIIRAYSKKLFCWFTAICKSIVITSFNNKFGIVFFFDQCSIFSDLFSHTIFTKISPFWDIKLYQFCQLKFKLFLQIGR